jgi:hypothetical protein
MTADLRCRRTDLDPRSTLPRYGKSLVRPLSGSMTNSEPTASYSRLGRFSRSWRTLRWRPVAGSLVPVSVAKERLWCRKGGGPVVLFRPPREGHTAPPGKRRPDR